MNKAITGIAMYAVGVLALSAAMPGWAQVSTNEAGPHAAADTSDNLGEIVVTARRKEERLQDVPISIAVFSQQELTDHNVTGAQDLANYTPSLSANTNFGNDNSSYAIRGFVQDIGTPPSVGVYFADVVAPRGPSAGISAGDGAGPGYFYDLQNVQVLKGPQGTLFGRNTTGGAVLFVPQKPTGEFGGYVEASYGNYDMRRVQAALNLPISDIVRFRIAFDDQRRDGYINNDSGIGPARLDDLNYTAVRASLVVDVTPNLENYTIASYMRSANNGPIQKLIAYDSTPSAANLLGPFACAQLAREQQRGAGFYTAESDYPAPESLLEQWQAINTTTWHATDTLTFKNIASYAQLRDTLNSALFGTDWPLVPGAPPLEFAFIQSAPGDWGTDQSTFTEEFQIQGSALDQRLTYQGGAYVEVSNPYSWAGTQPSSLLSCTNPLTFQCTDLLGIAFTQAVGAPVNVGAVNYNVEETTYRDYGIYEQLTYSVTDRLKLTEGLRYTWDRDRNTSQMIAYNFPVVPPYTAAPTPKCIDLVAFPCFQTSAASSSAPTWVTDLDYNFTDDVMVYGKYTRGYRAGGVFPSSPADYRVFQPEKVDTYETGFKTTFGGPVHGTFDFAAFYNDFRNQQLQVGFYAAPGVALGPTTGIVNAGRSRIYGAEVETSITPLTGLTFGLNYTYLNAKILDIAPLVSTDPNYVLSSQIPVGSPLALTPRNKAVLSGVYTLPLDPQIGRISFGANFAYTAKQLSNYAYTSPAAVAALGGNFGVLGSRELLDLNLNWNSIAGSTIDAGAFATNVTDRHYYTYIPGLGLQAGFETASVGAPRMYGLRVRYRFGR
jgi:iron complex outermembrane recepter protein